MDAKQYVNAIARKTKCGEKKKKEIKKQLLTEINVRMEQGEKPEEIISRMGTVKEIADGFNENLTITEQKQYVRNRVLKILMPIVAVLVLLLLLICWWLPKSVDIEQSKYFSKEQVEAAMKDTVALLDAEDYDSLQQNAIPQMQSVLNAEVMESAKGQVAAEWGERQQFGSIYLTELIQGNTYYAVGEITVTYEKVSVTYRLTYDKEMRLAGLYIR